MPRGLSVHVFKNPGPAPAPLLPSYYPASKAQPNQDRPVSNDVSRPKFERKPSSSPNDPLRISQPAVYVDPKRAKSLRGHDIYPYSTDTYIYDRPFAAATGALATSPSSSSSESDIFSESAVSASIEISSTRASSSTETLEMTALAIEYPSSTRPSYPRAGSSSDWSRIAPDGARILPPGLPPISRSGSMRANGTLSGPVWPPLVDAESDTEDGTFVNDSDDVGMQTQGWPGMPAPRDDGVRDPRYVGPRFGPTPARRYPDERSSTQQFPLQRMDSDAPRGPLSVVRASDNRNPPGFSSNTGSTNNVPVDDERRKLLSRANTVPAASGTQASRVGDRLPGTSPPSASQPNRTNDHQRQDAPAPSMTRATSTSGGTLAVATRRAVRWTEDLMCPCPIPRSERRKGWFNRRGDQLWTNDGRFKPPEPGKEYPPDLVGYPEPNTGWMNEEGVRIDMEHCLVPKPPLRSALKRPKTGAGAQ
ncbi:hypothetical protein DAEQUDRAFT_730048 [Daedalea quercina L-15889]|uniref:Uncharacterized protein n=1 Tax=Daedalea quercina L-15889 TaxID=1314783 RepID=A0A165N7W2_9APHY|nr:hypothetical protein DAEQUDRAFT_730048 [Daedalea quercina L-15889]